MEISVSPPVTLKRFESATSLVEIRIPRGEKPRKKFFPRKNRDPKGWQPQKIEKTAILEIDPKWMKHMLTHSFWCGESKEVMLSFVTRFVLEMRRFEAKTGTAKTFREVGAR